MALASEPTTWTYSDWITSASGSTTRLTRLRLHIQEVADRIASGTFIQEGKEQHKELLQKYLADLLEREESEAAVTATADTGTSATQVGWTRGRARL